MDISEEPFKQSSFRPPWLTILFLSVILASALAVPMIFLGNASGHDFQPHVASWLEVAGQWREGNLFPRWAAGANFGFGEPRFIFYPPGSGIIGAALGTVLPWRMVPGAFIWLTIILACMSMWFFAREWLTETQAVVASLLYIANPYSFALIYYRSDFAEFLASALFPLLFSGTVGVVRGNWRRMPLLAFAMAGIWLANAPAAVVATYSVALIVVVGCVSRRSFEGLLLGASALFAGLFVSAFYLVPAWWEQRFVQIANAASVNYSAENNFLFTRLNDPDYNLFNWKISAIAVTLIVFTGLGLVLCFRQRHRWSEVWWGLAALYCAAVSLMVPISGFFWRHLPEMRFLQFPWRWLLAVNVAFAFFGGAAGRPGWSITWWISLMLVILAAAATIAGDTDWDSEDLNAVVQAVSAGRGYEGIEGFQPRDARSDDLDESAPLVSEYDPVSGDTYEPEETKIVIRQWSSEQKSFDETSPQPVSLALRLLSYPAWEVHVDGQSIATQTVPETGQLSFPLTAGTHHVQILFRRTRDRTIGGLISISSFIGLLLLMFFALRSSHGTEGLRAG